MKRAVSAVSKILLLVTLVGTLMGADNSCDVKVSDTGISVNQNQSSSDKFQDWVDSLFN